MSSGSSSSSSSVELVVRRRSSTSASCSTSWPPPSAIVLSRRSRRLNIDSSGEGACPAGTAPRQGMVAQLSRGVASAGPTARGPGGRLVRPVRLDESPDSRPRVVRLDLELGLLRSKKLCGASGSTTIVVLDAGVDQGVAELPGRRRPGLPWSAPPKMPRTGHSNCADHVGGAGVSLRAGPPGQP